MNTNLISIYLLSILLFYIELVFTSFLNYCCITSTHIFIKEHGWVEKVQKMATQEVQSISYFIIWSETEETELDYSLS